MLPRRKPATAPGPLLALARKPTQPSKVPASRRTVESGKTAEKSHQEHMDTSEAGSRKRKNSGGSNDREGKHPTT